MRQTWTHVPAHLDLDGTEVAEVWRLASFGNPPCPGCGKVPRALSWLDPEAYQHPEAREFVEEMGRKTVENIKPCPCQETP